MNRTADTDKSAPTRPVRPRWLGKHLAMARHVGSEAANVYELITADPDLTQAQIATELAISVSSVKRHIQKLDQKGVLKVGRQGRTNRYHVPTELDRVQVSTSFTVLTPVNRGQIEPNDRGQIEPYREKPTRVSLSNEPSLDGEFVFLKTRARSHCLDEADQSPSLGASPHSGDPVGSDSLACADSLVFPPLGASPRVGTDCLPSTPTPHPQSLASPRSEVVSAASPTPQSLASPPEVAQISVGSAPKFTAGRISLWDASAIVGFFRELSGRRMTDKRRQSWARSVLQMLFVDKRSPEQLVEVIAWVFTESGGRFPFIPEFCKQTKIENVRPDALKVTRPDQIRWNWSKIQACMQDREQPAPELVSVDADPGADHCLDPPMPSFYDAPDFFDEDDGHQPSYPKSLPTIDMADVYERQARYEARRQNLDAIPTPMDRHAEDTAPVYTSEVIGNNDVVPQVTHEEMMAALLAVREQLRAQEESLLPAPASGITAPSEPPDNAMPAYWPGARYLAKYIQNEEPDDDDEGVWP